MSQIWEANEERDEEEELVETEQRDTDEPTVFPEDEQVVESTVHDARQVLDEYGEDVSSSPAERGHDVPPSDDEP